MTTHPIDWKTVSDDVYKYADSNVPASAATKKALKVIEDALERYGINAVGLSFNGGKDCTVVLHIAVAALYRYLSKKANAASPSLPSSASASSTATSPNLIPSSTPPSSLSTSTPSSSSPSLPSPSITHQPIKTFYVTYPNAFPEEEAFVQENAKRYGLDFVKQEIPSSKFFRGALQDFLNRSPEVRAILVGTRRTDPHGANLEHFTLTDPGYITPQVMRVHPVIDWTYSQVWQFLRDLNVPYCPIYDLGYTSLGSKDTTFPNPALANPSKACGYDPAWKLAEAGRERDGRE